MFAPLLLFVTLAVTSRSTRVLSKTVELGKVVDLREINLLEDFQEHEKTIFEPFDSKCFIDETHDPKGKEFKEYYKNSNTFYKSLGLQSGLDASLQSSYTLGFSLKVATKSMSSETNTVSGMSFRAVAKTEKILVKRDCLEGDGANLKKSFLKALKYLPVRVKYPWKESSWEAYHNFLKKYGTHIVTSVSRGASFRQMTFAESSKSYSERNFEVRSCLSLAGFTTAGEVDFKGCANISQIEKSRAINMDTTDKVFVSGGSLDTGTKLFAKETRSVKGIQKLLNEAREAPSTIEHTFVAIWNILQTRYEIGSDNHIRGLNLEHYFLGFLNYGCPYIARKIEVQKFSHTKTSNKTSPKFECTIAEQGCHSNNDCHYKAVRCSCYGDSCVAHKSVKPDNAVPKTTAYLNYDQDWGWGGCVWKVPGFYCRCKNKKRKQRVRTWPVHIKDAAAHNARSHNGHLEAKDPAQRKSKGKEETRTFHL